MYEDMYEDYSCCRCCFDYNYPFSFDKRNIKYLQFWPNISAWWYYGETINLTLKVAIDTKYESLEKMKLIVSFYNFRKEVILEKTFEPEDVRKVDDDYVIDYFIDADTSKEFTGGIYYCGIKLISGETEEDITTVLDKDNYLIRVI